MGADRGEGPFQAFLKETRELDPSRARLADAARAKESACVQALLSDATLTPEECGCAEPIARALICDLRGNGGRRGAAADLLFSFALSSREGVALMRLAEALLRIPDHETQGALIRDTLSDGRWLAHRSGRSIALDAAALGLALGRLAAVSALWSGSEPLARAAMTAAIRALSRRFVIAETIEEALIRARAAERLGFSHSFDMLGETATTRSEAQAYARAYAQAIDRIGAAAAGREPIERASVSIKLSALHPRYERAQQARVRDELSPVLASLVRAAKASGVAVTIDAEEADRLDLSLDCFEALCADPDLAGWDGLGFVIQAYQKRATGLVEHLINLARRTRRRLNLRLVKGAYWDAEIKRAQADGLDFPVFTRKEHTDCSFLACARALFAAPDAVFPQFGTHNAHTLAALAALARTAGDPPFELQRLYGMGEGLFEAALAPGRLGRRFCRIYAPVGPHGALVPYLLRRLLENGATSSFVRRVADRRIPIEHLASDPAREARARSPVGAPDPRVMEWSGLFPDRKNSRGFDLWGERALRRLALDLVAADASCFLATAPWDERAASLDPARDTPLCAAEPICAKQPAEALSDALAGAEDWARLDAEKRAERLERAAELLESRAAEFVARIVREAGRTIPDAAAELRESVDFLRYYAGEAKRLGGSFRGPLVSISPWNFPLSIFVGQAAAALACGASLVAKPAEQTSLIGHAALRLLIEAGVSSSAIHLVRGGAAEGRALVADPRVRGVLFTGSLAAARDIASSLAGRLDETGQPIPFVAETGGLNAMIVDSSALPQQVVRDALASAFGSAGQRCSSLRILCVQREIADSVLERLEEALLDLRVDRPDRLETDLGPLIDREAVESVRNHIERMRSLGRRVVEGGSPSRSPGFFLAPTLIEIDRVTDLDREVFGPVLHVLRYDRKSLPGLLTALAETGYGLTLGLQTRIDSAMRGILARRLAGNQYVNRTMIGAVVGLQPFGGFGLSGTGPKAGGPLYLRKFIGDGCSVRGAASPGSTPPGWRPWRAWLARSRPALVEDFDALVAGSPYGACEERPGPAGESNVWEMVPRGPILCAASDLDVLLRFACACVASGDVAVVHRSAEGLFEGAPDGMLMISRDPAAEATIRAALFEGSDADLIALQKRLAARSGSIVPVLRPPAAAPPPLLWLLRESTTTVNHAALGGALDLLTLV